MPQHNLSHRYEKMKYSQFYRNVPTFDWLCMMMLIIELCALLEERETKDPRKTRYVFSRILIGDSSAYVWHAQAKQCYIDLVTIQLQDIKHHEND